VIQARESAEGAVKNLSWIVPIKNHETGRVAEIVPFHTRFLNVAHSMINHQPSVPAKHRRSADPDLELLPISLRGSQQMVRGEVTVPKRGTGVEIEGSVRHPNALSVNVLDALGVRSRLFFGSGPWKEGAMQDGQ
jgi:hypothetical protein